MSWNFKILLREAKFDKKTTSSSSFSNNSFEICYNLSSCRGIHQNLPELCPDNKMVINNRYSADMSPAPLLSSHHPHNDVNGSVNINISSVCSEPRPDLPLTARYTGYQFIRIWSTAYIEGKCEQTVQTQSSFFYIFRHRPIFYRIKPLNIRGIREKINLFAHDCLAFSSF